MSTRSLPPRSTAVVGLVALLIYAGLLGLYWNTRYGGNAIEGDATRLTLAAEGSLSEGQVVPTWRAYQAGFGYPSTLATLAAVTGVRVQAVQLQLGLWLVIFILVIFICYRELLGDAVTALLAAFLLLVQPDFLFYILRGSHEKQTWLLMALMLYILARSYRYPSRPGSFATHVTVFYLAFWAMIATTAYWASTILFALSTAAVFGWLLFRIEGRRTAALSRTGDVAGDGAQFWLRRFLLSGIIGFVLIYVFINHVYPPAVGYYSTLQNIVDRLGVLFFGAEELSAPYAVVQAAWVSPAVYRALVAVQFMLALCGLAAWLIYLRRWLGGGWSSAPRTLRLLWLLYGGFLLQIVLGVTLDFAGLLSLNLQLRLFPPFAMIFSPLAALLLREGLERRWAWRKAVRFIAVPFAVLATLACLLKVTTDPLVSNLWLFYTEHEVSAQDWVDTRIAASQVWLDTWRHQYDVMEFRKGYDWWPANDYVSGFGETEARYVMLSSLTRLQANRSGLPLPSVLERNRVYDNGSVQVFHQRPVTPFQK